MADGQHADGRDEPPRQERLRRIADAPDLEMMAPVTLSIVCFRYRTPGREDHDLDALNQAIAETLNESGDVFFTPTVLCGRTVLRATIIHYDTNESDLDFLVTRIRETGRALADQ